LPYTGLIKVALSQEAVDCPLDSAVETVVLYGQPKNPGYLFGEVVHTQEWV